MSLVIRGRGRTTTVKPRRPRPQPAGGKVTANPYVTDNKPKPKLGSKPRGKVTPVRGTVNDKPKPRPARAKASGKRFAAHPMSSSGKTGPIKKFRNDLVRPSQRRPRGRR